MLTKVAEIYLCGLGLVVSRDTLISSAKIGSRRGPDGSRLRRVRAAKCSRLLRGLQRGPLRSMPRHLAHTRHRGATAHAPRPGKNCTICMVPVQAKRPSIGAAVNRETTPTPKTDSLEMPTHPLTSTKNKPTSSSFTCVACFVVNYVNTLVEAVSLGVLQRSVIFDGKGRQFQKDPTAAHGESPKNLR